MHRVKSKMGTTQSSLCLLPVNSSTTLAPSGYNIQRIVNQGTSTSPLVSKFLLGFDLQFPAPPGGLVFSSSEIITGMTCSSSPIMSHIVRFPIGQSTNRHFYQAGYSRGPDIISQQLTTNVRLLFGESFIFPTHPDCVINKSRNFYAHLYLKPSLHF